MKNKFLSLCLMLAAMLGFAACEPQETTPELKENITLKSSSVANGSSVNAARTTVITLDYSPNEVKVNFDSKVTLNGVEVSARRSTANTSLVDVRVALEPNTDYELIVPAGTIVGLTDQTRTAPKLVLKFDTRSSSSDDEISAANLVQVLGFGWNLGNHFDSFDENNAAANYRITWDPSCPYWDGVRPQQQLYTSLAENGVKTVRMCVTWGPYQNMEDGQYTIDADYMAEVKQNVDWALEAGMYVLLNTHHDEYWQDIISAAKSGETNTQIKDRITKTWTQIAAYYKDYNQHLLFETFNELHDQAWGWSSGYNYQPVFRLMDEWNQLAVDAIRATGGNNATRWIGVPGFCANHMFTDGQRYLLQVPNDPANHIMVAVHCYDPFNFCTEGTMQQWGHNAPGHTDQDEKNLRFVFESLKKAFVDKGIPCYMGEFGCETRLSQDDEKYRTYFMEYFCRAGYTYGIPVMLWDNNNNNQATAGGGGECFWYVNHLNGHVNTPELLQTMVKAATSTNGSYTLESIYDKAPN